MQNSVRPLQLKGRLAPGSAPFSTDWICGAIMLARSETVRRLGGFDPRFFLYFEVTDLGLRAQTSGYEL
jgi:N-acetylglucosaminyl-diphospho-decaprenol L-rhamnosyltransferase